MGIYLARAAEYRIFKVGYSLTPETRIADISGGFPVEVIADRILEDGSRFDERYLHDCLVRYRLRGEWFSDEGLTYARGLIDDLRVAREGGGADGVATIIAQHVPGDAWDAVKANLYAAGASNIANALTNITGQSVMPPQWEAA